MSEAQAYYDGMISQGYSAEQATQSTNQYFPDFAAGAATPAPAPAAEATPIATPPPSEPAPAMESPVEAAPMQAAPMTLYGKYSTNVVMMQAMAL